MLAIWINLRAFIMLSTETVPQRHYRLFTKPAADSETGENISELNLGPKQNQRTISHYKATLYRERVFIHLSRTNIKTNLGIPL